MQPRATLGRLEACGYLSVSRTTLDRLVKLGAIRKTKVGARTVFTVRELERFLERQTVEPGRRPRRHAATG